MKISTSMRASIGYLLVGILGVIVGALIVACSSGKIGTFKDAESNISAASAAPIPNGAVDLEQRIVSIVKRTEPSVVLIRATVRGQQINPFNDPLFRQFFGDQFGGPSQPFIAKASGSGFIIKHAGSTALVATNAHVVFNADHIEVLLSNGRKVSAERVGSDIRTDLALLRISGDNLPPALKLGDSNALQQGQFVIAIGEPESFQNSVSFGIVSALHRADITASGGETFGIPSIRYADLLQTTAPINPGNSGGPLINLRGEVVGIAAVVDPRAQAIGFAIPISAARPIFGQLEVRKSIAHPYIGIVMQPVNQQIANYLGYREKTGVVITNIVTGSPADKAGLQQGDIIVELNHKKVTSPDEIRNAVAQMKVGNNVSLLVWRDGNLQPFEITLADEPQSLPQG